MAESDRPAEPVFPSDFVWGVATAAYQIEGAAGVDGRGPSIWDTFSHTPGRVLGGDTGDVACDHYHRYPEDLDRIAWLGCSAYRFSIAWPRVQPTGQGRPDPRGLAFYDRLVDGLLERGIAPWATLYHWDLPQALEDTGGWADRSTALRFADYAAVVQEHLGDRLASVTTLNEPWCSSLLGYAGGQHAPGRADDAAAIAAVHHLLLGHGLALTAMRAQGATAPLGITLNLYPVEAASEAAADQDARRRIDGLVNRIFLDPLLRGSYPSDVMRDLEGVTDFGFVQPGDLETISRPLDFLGENYYSPHVVAGSSSPAGPPAEGDGPVGTAVRSPWPAARDVVFAATGLPVTQMGWEVEPQGLERVLHRLRTDYDCPPLYITENGAAYEDHVVAGEVDDPDRVAYLQGHVAALSRAIQAGADVRGYFLWSLLDNFEWSFGYSRRFGIVHVDFDTQVRTPKRSAHWYRDFIARR
jgi:beta-glucosidase